MNQVVLIFGGPSAEHDVSLVSAKNIYQALKETSLAVHLLGITRDSHWKLISGEELESTNFDSPLDLDKVGTLVSLINEDKSIFIKPDLNSSAKIGPIDVAFPIVHGPYGEDGKLQSELNSLGLKFVGSDRLSCENSFDKEKTKNIIAQLNVPQVPWLVFEDEVPNFDEVDAELGLPFFVKPANMGSSVGISKVKNKEQFSMAIAEAQKYDTKIVIEKGLTVRELETALLEDGELKVADISELKPHHEFYSYEAKYIDPKGADSQIPADIPKESKEILQNFAKICFQALGCRDYARADFFMDNEGKIYFNEINTHPGFTSISQFPQLWLHQGMSYKDLIVLLLERAFKRIDQK